MSTHEERKNKIDKQMNEIMKVGLEKWLQDNRSDKDSTMWWKTIHSDVVEYYSLCDKRNEPLFHNSEYSTRMRMDDRIRVLKKGGYINDILYDKWEEIRSKERVKENQEADKLRKEVEMIYIEKEKEINKILETIKQKLLLMYSAINC